MTLVTLGWLLGVTLFQWLPNLPADHWSLAALCLPFLFMLKPLRWLAAASCGFLWAWWWGISLLATGVDTTWEGQDVALTGVIASVPEVQPGSTRFEFDIEELRWRGEPRPAPQRVILSWYEKAPILVAGDRWQLYARLKAPHGFMNPGGFDYEGWLFSRGIRGTGYVRDTQSAARLGRVWGVAQLHRLRQALATRLNQTLAERPLGAAVIGLVVGVTHGMTGEQWDTLAATGTTHLMAISGMHITFVAGIAFFLARGLWGLWPGLPLRWPAPRAAAVAGIIAAIGYAALAGFTVPTQRAVIMVAVVLGSLLVGRGAPGVRTLVLALAAVSAWSPIAVLSPGFWLSFGAVALIVYGMGGRWQPSGWWWKWGRLQWLLGLALAPLLIGFFGQVSLFSPLANLVAVPWVELLTVPLALSGALLLCVIPSLGEWLLWGAEYLLRGLWWLLERIAQWPGSEVSVAGASGAAVLAAMVGVLIILAPRGVPGRWLGVFWCVPLVMAQPLRPPPGEAWLTLLDVGQGLAAVVQTQQHTLLYDAGPRWRDGFNAGSAVVVPFLRASGVHRLDTVIVGHSDNDHIGGVQAVLKQLGTDRLLTSAPEQLPAFDPQLCVQGAHWEWDGVEFDLLHPALPYPAADNDRSCVLRVAAAGTVALLPGDIEAAAETALLSRAPAQLRAQVLVVPHHGSTTSSTAAFLDAVSPTLALVSTGYRNRFGFPRPVVMQRYIERGIPLLNTAQEGAITVRLAVDGRLEPFSFRVRRRHYWHQLGS